MGEMYGICVKLARSIQGYASLLSKSKLNLPTYSSPLNLLVPIMNP